MLLEFITYQSDKGKKIYLLDTLTDISVQPNTPQKVDFMAWDTRLAIASPNTRELIAKLISDSETTLKCIGKSLYGWFGLYVDEPDVRKNLFGVIMAGKNSVTVCFMVRLDEFKSGNDNVRYVKGFFFPTGTERRIRVEESKLDKLLQYLKHAQEVTISQSVSK